VLATSAAAGQAGSAQQEEHGHQARSSGIEPGARQGSRLSAQLGVDGPGDTLCLDGGGILHEPRKPNEAQG